jgi:hypothetical protein
MSDSPVELDLKFLPDWLKEAPSTNRYADFEGETADTRRRDSFGRDDRRGPRPGGGRGPGGPRPGGPSRGPGGPRPGGGKFERRDPRGPGGQRGPGGPRPGPGGPRRDDRGPRPGYQQEHRPPPEPRRQVVKVDIVPEPAAGAGISKQIKASARACGVFKVAKMFLDRPERFRARITSLDPNAPLFQAGTGPVACDRADVERGAFRALRDEFYVTETTQGDPPKGNFSTVARDRFSGALLGPSSHHGYQAALRKLYDERYSRRLEWEAFLRNIENVSDPAAIEQWKQQASSVTLIKTKVAEGEEPQVFKTEYDAEQHFRATHLPSIIKSGRTLEVAGPMALAMLDRNIGYAVRDAIERERRVPLGIVNGLRPYFGEAGLHLFKWKRKILYASAIRPQRHPADTSFSDGMSAILTLVGEKPGIKRPELAAKLLAGLDHDAPETVAKREALAADLHYLVHIGYVVEFQNGCLELPPAKKDQHQEHPAEEHKVDVAAEMEGLDDGHAEGAKAKAEHREAAPVEAEAPAARADAPAENTGEEDAPVDVTPSEDVPAEESDPAVAEVPGSDCGYQLLPLAAAVLVNPA